MRTGLPISFEHITFLSKFEGTVLLARLLFLENIISLQIKQRQNTVAKMPTMNRLSICAGVFLVVVQPLHAYVAVPPEARSFISGTVLSDTTNLGSLVVPSVGIGTISWSSNKGRNSIVVWTRRSENPPPCSFQEGPFSHQRWYLRMTQFSQSRMTTYRSW